MEQDDGSYDTVEAVPSVSNSAALYLRRAVCEAGLFDEDFNMYMEDVDMNYRLRKKGWRVIYAPQARSCHILHGSRQSQHQRLYYQERNRLLFIAKHFPGELPSLMHGFGGISAFSQRDFREIIYAAAEKLRHSCKKDELENLMKEFNKSVEKINDYRAHCFSIDLDRKTATMARELSEREKIIGELKEQLSHLVQEKNTLVTQLKTVQDESAGRMKEIAAFEGQMKVLQEALEEARRSSQEEIGRYSRILEARDAEIKTLRETLEWHAQQLNSRLAELTIVK